MYKIAVIEDDTLLGQALVEMLTSQDIRHLQRNL